MRLIRFIVFFPLMLVFFGSPAFSSDEITPDEVLRIAEKEKEAYFGMIAFDYAAKYGASVSSGKTVQAVEDPFMDAAEKQNRNVLKLGTPFRVYTMKTDAVANYRESDNISDMLIPTYLWLIPLEIHGKANACMEVGFQNEKWQAVGISMGEFGENLKKIPAEFAPGKNGNRFVRIYPAYRDFIAVEKRGETKVMIPPYAEKSFEKITKDSQGLFRSSDVMPELAKKIRDAQTAQY